MTLLLKAKKQYQQPEVVTQKSCCCLIFSVFDFKYENQILNYKYTFNAIQKLVGIDSAIDIGNKLPVEFLEAVENTQDYELLVAGIDNFYSISDT